ncbi:hypothetical protein Ciccas_014555, partial [Cichlidogyrus casuarinus]
QLARYGELTREPSSLRSSSRLSDIQPLGARRGRFPPESSEISSYEHDPRMLHVPLLSPVNSLNSQNNTFEEQTHYHPSPPSEMSVAPTVMTTATDASSIGPAISDELIATRILWPKILLILMSVAQLISSWTCIVAHGSYFNENTPRELGFSLGFLLGGQYL